MADLTIIYALVGVSIVQAILTIVAAYYAYRVTRVVGLFWAWGAIVAAFAIDAFRNVQGLVTFFLIPPDQLNELLSSFSPVQIWSGQIFSLASATLLAAGMYGLFKIFSRRKSVEVPRPGT